MELWMPMMKSINKTVGNGTAVLLVFLAAWIFFCRIPSLGLPDEKEAELFSGPDTRREKQTVCIRQGEQLAELSELPVYGQTYDGDGDAELDKLPAGVWYVAAETDRKGRYIEELEQWEHFGSQFVFCMIKEEAA